MPKAPDTIGPKPITGWTSARIAVYIGALFAGVAFILATLGAGTYDPATGMFDLHPFSVYWLAGIVAGPVASFLAFFAAMMGWGARHD